MENSHFGWTDLRGAGQLGPFEHDSRRALDPPRTPLVERKRRGESLELGKVERLAGDPGAEEREIEREHGARQPPAAHERGRILEAAAAVGFGHDQAAARPEHADAFAEPARGIGPVFDRGVAENEVEAVARIGELQGAPLDDRRAIAEPGARTRDLSR